MNILLEVKNGSKELAQHMINKIEAEIIDAEKKGLSIDSKRLEVYEMAKQVYASYK